MRASPSRQKESLNRKINKLGLRAKGLSLLPLALRPGLLEEETVSVNRKFRLTTALITTILALGFSFIVTSSSTSAASITLTIPAAPLSLEIGTDGNFKTSEPANVSVKTDSLSGYRLTINSQSGDNKLKGNSNELVSIPKNLTEEEFSSGAEYINNWGYRPSKLNGETNNFFIPGPTAMLATIDTTKARNSDPNVYTFAIAAKADSSTPDGAYTDTFTLCASSNGNDYNITYDLNEGTGGPTSPQTGTVEGNTVQLASEAPTKDNSKFMGWCSVEPTGNDTDSPTCSGGLYQPGNTLALCDGGNTVTLYAMWENGKYMQNWTGCSQLSEHEIIELQDKRDGNSYKVAKLKDGKCWMVENLRIAGKVLTSADSDVSSDFSLPASSKSSFSQDSAALVYVEEQPYEDHGIIGGHYSWTAATAGTSLTTGAYANATGSICPKGWRLPTGGSGGEFEVMANKYGSSSNYQSWSSALQASPAPNFGLFGNMYRHDYLEDRGGEGEYWSSSSGSSTSSAYSLTVFSTSVSPYYHHSRFGGFSVRCVAR